MRSANETTMPYNTRRKSLSLPMLGIQLPGAPRPIRSPPTTSEGQHIAKKQKRSHSNSSSMSMSPPQHTPLRIEGQRPKSSGRLADTPPPSPGGDSGPAKVDTSLIDDEIVAAVIDQLQKTGNRPHLLKELAMILSPIVPIVENSANSPAIISSRLATYLKRNWTALSKCPLDKKLVGTHPKRVYYFLSTCPHQPIPADPGNIPAAARIISPSLSSAASEEEELDARSRDRMSPSPELDLSDYDSNPTEPFSERNPQSNTSIPLNGRAQSPPLEREEREFTQTAILFQQRWASQAAERSRSQTASVEPAQKDVVMEEVITSVEETEESAARKNSEAAAALFGEMEHSPLAPSSPALKPSMHIEMAPMSSKRSAAKAEIDLDFDDWHMKSPESIELDELDDLFDEF